MKAAVVLILIGTGVAAQTDLPAFSDCISTEADRYEWRLDIHRDRSLDAEDFALWSVLGVDYCGTVGIVRCDRSDDPMGCQAALETEQDALRDAIRATLPKPDADQGWPARLYEQTYALAYGSSAGADCAGTTQPMRAWCAVREANNRLKITMLAWQVGRYLDVTPPGREAGWAGPPIPVRPMARPTN